MDVFMSFFMSILQCACQDVELSGQQGALHTINTKQPD